MSTVDFERSRYHDLRNALSASAKARMRRTYRAAARIRNRAKEPYRSKTVPLNTEAIKDFVRRSDAAKAADLSGEQVGALGRVWEHVQLALPSVPHGLDPFSDEWRRWQLGLHEVVTGKDYVPADSEQYSDFEFEQHVRAHNAYEHPDASHIASHHNLLSRIARASGLGVGRRWLEFGSGWGFTAEFLASMGFDVLGVDVNDRFIDLATARSERLGFDRLRYVTGQFETFTPDEQPDAIIFYECLHHSTDPLALLRRCANLLPDGGFLVAGAEPFVPYWGFGWGIRSDALSLYCMGKYGWFETGWSVEFLASCFLNAGFTPVYFKDPVSDFGNFMAGFKGTTIPPRLLREVLEPTGWYLDNPDELVGRGVSALPVLASRPTKVRLDLENRSLRTMSLSIASSSAFRKRVDLPPGPNAVSIPVSPGRSEFTLTGRKWSPAGRFHSPDARSMTFHLNSIEIST
jgi:SAM-dependent methyltransferase